MQQDSTGVCSRCSEALSFGNGTPEKGSPNTEAATRAADGAADAGGTAVVSGGLLAAEGSPPVLVDEEVAGGGGDPAVEQGEALQALREAHAAELASMQDAFTARMQALQEDLQVSFLYVLTTRDIPNT